MKTELVDAGAVVWGGGDVVVWLTGDDRSKRSPMAEDWAGFGAAG